MWLFTSNKDPNAPSTTGVSSLTSLAFSYDPVPGYSFDLSNSDREKFCIRGPYGIHWWLKPALRKKSSEKFSIITCTLPPDQKVSLMESVRQTVKWMKTLRHPNILNWIDGTPVSPEPSSTDFHIITERVIPLREYLRTKADSGNFNFMCSWGLHQIARALAFLNDGGKLAHNAVRLDAIFVTTAGEWKLGALDFVGSVDDAPPDSRLADSSNRGRDPYLPPDNRLVDPWGLGCLIWELFNANAPPLTDRAQLTAPMFLQYIPEALVPVYRLLLAPTAKRRCTVANFISKSLKRHSSNDVGEKRSGASNGFFVNPYVETLLFLEEIELKDAQAKSDFLASLTDQLKTFPEDVCRHKLLPHLLTCLRYGSAGIDALLPLLRLASLLPSAEFETTVLPCLLRLFASPERATRVRLLQQLPSFVDQLSDKVIQDQVFPSVVTGFTDANPLVREATVRAMVHLAPKLSGKPLADVLPRHLVALQTKDDQGGIRTNATVCMAKVAPYLPLEVQRGAMLNAFLRVTRDPFLPGRQAAIAAIAATQEYYSPDLLSGKILPCLSFLTVDPERTVRDDCFRAIRGVLERLEQASEHPELEVTASSASADSSSGGKGRSATAAVVSQWALSALSSLSSRLLTSSSQSQQTKPTDQSAASAEAAATAGGGGSLSAIGDTKQPVVPTSQARKPEPRSPKPQVDINGGSGQTVMRGEDGGDDDDDDWGSLEGSESAIPATRSNAVSRKSSSPPAKSAAPTSAYNWDRKDESTSSWQQDDWNSDDFFKSLTGDVSSKPRKLASQKPAVTRPPPNKSQPSTAATKKPTEAPKKKEPVAEDTEWGDW